jgi:glutathione S-transferase
MTLTVYSISGAPRPWRVLLGLEFKRLDYELIYLQASKQEHRSPEFRKLNPHGKIPVVVHNGVARRESLSILAWLDRTFPGPKLYGASAEQTAEIWEAAALFDDYLQEATSGVASPVFKGDGTPPLPNSEESKTLHQARDLLKVEYQLLEDRLQNRLFLCGEAPSAADAVAYPPLAVIKRAQRTRPDIMAEIGLADIVSDFPRLNAWCTRIEELPGFENTYPPHWQEAAAA